MPRFHRILFAVFPLFYGLPACGGDATVANPDEPLDTTPDGAMDAAPEATPDGATDAAPEATTDAAPEATPDGATDADPNDPVSCTPSATVTVEVHVFYPQSPSSGVDVTAHCSDGRFFARTKANADGIATINVPAGGLVTASCPGSLSTVGGIEEGGSLDMTCGSRLPPGNRPPGPPIVTYTVALVPFHGATSYRVRGNAGNAKSVDAGPVSVKSPVGKGDIVAYALDAQSQRIAAAAKLGVSVYTGAHVFMGPFTQGVYPASVSLIHPRVEDTYEYTATLETSRAKTIETESVVAVLGGGEAASLSTRFATNVAQWNTVKVHYAFTEASGAYSSDLTLRKAADNLPFEEEIDLTTGMLPLMIKPSLLPAARPILDFEQVGPATCVTGPADKLFVLLHATHPNGNPRYWNLQLPGDTAVPWTLPELGTATEEEHWPGEQMSTLGIVVVRQTNDDPDTGEPVCISRSTFPPPPF